MLFVTVNLEEGDGSLEDQLNPDKSLIRAEFLEVVIRVANRKFLKVELGSCCVVDLTLTFSIPPSTSDKNCGQYCGGCPGSPTFPLP